MTIEIEKTYKITLTSEQLHELHRNLMHRESEIRGTSLGSLYREIDVIIRSGGF